MQAVQVPTKSASVHPGDAPSWLGSPALEFGGPWAANLAVWLGAKLGGQDGAVVKKQKGPTVKWKKTFAICNLGWFH